MLKQLSPSEKSDLYESLINDNIDGMVYQFHQSSAGEFTMNYISDGVQELYGLSSSDVKKDISCLFTCVHPDDVAKVNQSIEQSYINNTNWDCKYRIIVNGAEKTLHGRSKIQKHDDGTATWNGVVLDITHQQQSEDHLFKDNRSLEMITNNISDITMELDINGTILKLAPNVYDHLGYQKEELENQTDINLIHPNDRPETKKTELIV